MSDIKPTIFNYPNTDIYEIQIDQLTKGVTFLKDELCPVAICISDELGINDLLKLRDHVEQKIKEIYERKD